MKQIGEGKYIVEKGNWIIWMMARKKKQRRAAPVKKQKINSILRGYANRAVPLTRKLIKTYKKSKKI